METQKIKLEVEIKTIGISCASWSYKNGGNFKCEFINQEYPYCNLFNKMMKTYKDKQGNTAYYRVIECLKATEEK